MDVQAQLMFGVKVGDLFSVRSALDSNADVNSVTDSKARRNTMETPLIHASRHVLSNRTLSLMSCVCRNGHCSVVQLLLARRADFTLRNIANRTALEEAAGAGHEEVVRILHSAAHPRPKPQISRFAWTRRMNASSSQTSRGFH